MPRNHEQRTGTEKKYGYSESTRAASEPAYGRVLALLSDRELADEIQAGRGQPSYQTAAQAELRRRGVTA